MLDGNGIIGAYFLAFPASDTGHRTALPGNASLVLVDAANKNLPVAFVFPP